MSGQFQVDVDELTKFAGAIMGDQGQAGLISHIANNQDLRNQLDWLVATDLSPSGSQLYWGQDLFADAYDLANDEGRYLGQYGQLMDSLNKFLGALQALGEAASVIAQNYKNAIDSDSVNQQTVTDALNSAQPPQAQFFGGSGG
jgi:hypothetical protein